jgi:copper chaperone CopZ
MSLRTETIKVTGMTCGHCQKFVSNTIKDLPGVSEVEVMLDGAAAKVVYDDQKVTKEQIIKAVNNTQTYHAE